MDVYCFTFSLVVQEPVCQCGLPFWRNFTRWPCFPAPVLYFWRPGGRGKRACDMARDLAHSWTVTNGRGLNSSLSP
jgi:hypothetical protein